MKRASSSTFLSATVFRRTQGNERLPADDAISLQGSITIQSIGATILLSDLYDGTDNVSGLFPAPKE